MSGELSPLQSAALTHGIGNDELEHAYKVRRRSHWPVYDDAMLDPIYSRLVLIQALHGAIAKYSPPIHQNKLPPIEVAEPVHEDPPAREGGFTFRRKDDGPHWWDNI